jgi:hypothetical protein
MTTRGQRLDAVCRSRRALRVVHELAFHQKGRAPRAGARPCFLAHKRCKANYRPFWRNCADRNGRHTRLPRYTREPWQRVGWAERSEAYAEAAKDGFRVAQPILQRYQDRSSSSALGNSGHTNWSSAVSARCFDASAQPARGSRFGVRDSAELAALSWSLSAISATAREMTRVGTRLRRRGAPRNDNPRCHCERSEAISLQCFT